MKTGPAGEVGWTGTQEEEVQEEPPVEPQPLIQKQVAEPVIIYVYRQDDGYRYWGADAAGRIIEETGSDLFETAQMAKRSAHAAYPVLPIR